MERPHYAKHAAERRVGYVRDDAGRWQLEAQEGDLPPRRITAEPYSVESAMLSPDGDRIVWLKRHKDRSQTWQTQPFASSVDAHKELAPGVQIRNQHGIALANDEAFLLGVTIAGRDNYAMVRVFGNFPPFVFDGPTIRSDRSDRAVVGVLGDSPFGERLMLWQDTRPPSQWLEVGYLHQGQTLRLAPAPDGHLACRWLPGSPGYAVFGTSPHMDRLVTVFDEGSGSRLYEYDLSPLERGTNHAIVEPRLLPTPPGTIQDVHYVGPDTTMVRWGAIGHPWTDLVVGEAVPAGDPVPWEFFAAPWPDGPAGIPEVPVTVAYPDGERPRAGWPTAVFAHGGPHVRDGNRPLRPELEVLRQRGCAVAMVDYPGSTGYGEEYERAAHGRLGVTEADAIAAATHALITRGTADPTRIAAVGGSYSAGPLLIAAARHPRLFQAVSVISPLISLHHKMRTLSVPEQRDWHERVGGSPEQVPRKWRRASAVSYAKDLRCPTLMICHDDDRGTPMMQVKPYLRAAGQRGRKLIEVVRLDGGHHAFGQTAHATASAHEIERNFLLRHLGITDSDPPSGRPARRRRVTSVRRQLSRPRPR